MASKKKSRTSKLDQSAATSAQVESPAVDAATQDAPSADVAGRFIGQWNRLVSTTNWEKGRIICQWREALELSGAPASASSDEAWAQLVGGVTSQHVGRLRRVYQKFGAVFDKYEGLYWSHFQAGLDWDDAEMWLEGAILNNWSVSQMRGKRWETLGNAGEPPAEAAADPDMDEAEAAHAAFEGESASAAAHPAKKDDSAPWEAASNDESDAEVEAAPKKAKSRSRLAVDVDELPADLAEAFEQFKLAIIAQRRSGWREIEPTAVIECLDALKELALAPSDD